MSQTLLAHGILQSAWQPWQQHHGLGLAPQAFQMPCHDPQSAIPDWPLGRPSKLPTGRRISLRLSSPSSFTSAPTRTSTSTWPLPGFVPEFFPSPVSVLATAPALTPPPDRDPGVRPGISSPSLPQGQSSQTLTEDTPVPSASCPSLDPPEKSLHPSSPVHDYHISPRKPRKQARRSARNGFQHHPDLSCYLETP